MTMLPTPEILPDGALFLRGRHPARRMRASPPLALPPLSCLVPLHFACALPHIIIPGIFFRSRTSWQAQDHEDTTVFIRHLSMPPIFCSLFHRNLYATALESL